MVESRKLGGSVTFREFGGPRVWLAGLEGGNSRNNVQNCRNKEEISQAGACGNFGRMYILQDMTVSVA